MLHLCSIASGEMLHCEMIIQHYLNVVANNVCVIIMLITLASSFGNLFLGMMDSSLQMSESIQLESQLLIFMMIVLISIYPKISDVSRVMLCSNVMVISLHINSWMHANFTPQGSTLVEPQIIPWK